MNLENQMAVLTVFMNKICNNLKVWAKSERIIRETMALFDDIVLGYSTSKLVIKLEPIKYIINNHSVL